MKKFMTIIITIATIMSIYPQISLAAGNDFAPTIWPIKQSDMVKALDIYADGGNHEAIDIPNNGYPEQNVYAIANGIVDEVSNKCFHYDNYPHSNVANACGAGGLGNFVKIRHEVNGKTYYSRYSHLTRNSMVVNVGDVVYANQHIANMGSSGNSYGAHLHFEIWEGNWDSNKTKRTLDYYIDNISIIKGLRFHKGLTNSRIYGNWIKENFKLNGNYYEYNGPIHTHNFKHDVANEKCYCGETFVRQYQNINDTYTVSKSTSLRTKPYANYSERVLKLKKGDKVYVKRTFENVYGNVWCEAESGGYNGYVYFGDLKGESNLNIDLTSYPSSIKAGKVFGLRGTISSNYEIKKVSGYIKQGNTICQSTVDNPNATSMDVRGANLNRKLLFDKLSEGDYSLYIEAVDASGKIVSVNKNFSVYAEQTRVESTLSINLERYPVKISVGSMFSVRGNITSNYNISKVKGYIYNSNNAKVQETTDTPNSTYMEIRPANLNQKLIFNALSAGSYIMKVEAYDASGRVVTATKPFTVGDVNNVQKTSQSQPQTQTTPQFLNSTPETSIRFELESVPSGNLPYGKAFSLKGWFRSDSPIVEARAYMLDANKNVVMQSDAASSTTANYKIQGYKLDKAMKFNQLSPGGYYLKYFVRDANGDTATWMSDMFYIVK